jgi:hypothetical protein
MTRLGRKEITSLYVFGGTASVVQWSEFLATDLEVPDSISGAKRFSEK